MEEHTHSFLSDKADESTPLSGQQQEEIYFLNEDTGLINIADDQSLYNITPAENADFLELYKCIEGIELLAVDEELKRLLRQFEPESLVNLQLAGISISELIDSGTLLSLSLLIPAKVRIQPAGLAQTLILLISPHSKEDGYIHLTIMPYAKYIPSIPLTLKQQEAVKQATPFFTVKRIVDAVQSQAFEHKQNELWDTLTLSVSIQKKPFKELLEVIKYQPLGAEKWVQNQFWTKEQSEKAVKIIDSILPLQLCLFTGLHLLFYRSECLHQFPHLQAAIQARLLEQ